MNANPSLEKVSLSFDQSNTLTSSASLLATLATIMSSSHEKGDKAKKPTQGGGEGSSSGTKRDPNCLYVIKRKPGGGIDTIFAKVDPAEFDGLEALYAEVVRRVESAYTMGKGR
ncbi:Hypothetical predicted protein, partial [Prunus dulcis]